MEYTIREVPAAVDRELRKQAESEGKSLNDLALEALAARAGFVAAVGKPKRDISFMHGTLEDVKAIEEAHEWFDRVDEED